MLVGHERRESETLGLSNYLVIIIHHVYITVPSAARTLFNYVLRGSVVGAPDGHRVSKITYNT